MADMYGALSSNNFKVKNITAFKEWFNTYYFGDEVILFVIDETSREMAFAGKEISPSAIPRQFDENEGENSEVDLHQFANEIAEHLEEGEVLHIVAGGNEKLRYVLYDRLIIAAAHPEHPVYQLVTSSEDKAALLEIVESHKQEQADMAAV